MDFMLTRARELGYDEKKPRIKEAPVILTFFKIELRNFA